MQEEDGILPGKGSSATPVRFRKSQFLTSWDTLHHLLPACSIQLSNINSYSPCTHWPPPASQRHPWAQHCPRVRHSWDLSLLAQSWCWALPSAPHWLWQGEGRWDGEVLTQCSAAAQHHQHQNCDSPWEQEQKLQLLSLAVTPPLPRVLSVPSQQPAHQCTDIPSSQR